MKKIVKFILSLMAVVIILVLLLESFVYVSDYKITKVDKEEHAEVGDVDAIQEINPQAAYAGGSESQEDMELYESGTNLDDDSDSMEYINKYMIPEQSFDVMLDGWGKVTFVSCNPTYWRVNEEPSFFLVRDDQMLYKFSSDNLKGYWGLFDSIGAVAFRDINDDGKEDIVVIINYITGAEPQGMNPRPTVRIFLAGENEFYIADDIETDVVENIAKKDMTIESICNYLKENY